MTAEVQRVLFVDDEKHILSALRRALADEPYQVLTSESAEAALAIMEQSRISLLVTDFKMPGMSGIDLISRVRTRWPALPCVILTGYADEKFVSDAIQSGQATDLIAKPWEDSDLKVRLRRYLGGASRLTKPASPSSL